MSLSKKKEEASLSKIQNDEFCLNKFTKPNVYRRCAPHSFHMVSRYRSRGIHIKKKKKKKKEEK